MRLYTRCNTRGMGILTTIVVAFCVAACCILSCIFYTVCNVDEKISLHEKERDRKERTIRPKRSRSIIVVPKEFPRKHKARKKPIKKKILPKERKECSICLEEITRRTPVGCCNCGHCFHQQCIDRWLQRHTTCPLCRKTCSSLL